MIPPEEIACEFFFISFYMHFFCYQVDCNVICVDWENGAQIPNYVRAAVNTRLVGKQVSPLKSLLLRQIIAIC